MFIFKYYINMKMIILTYWCSIFNESSFFVGQGYVPNRLVGDRCKLDLFNVEMFQLVKT